MQKKKKASRASLSREQVLRAALGLADESGLQALSMRELGRKLGVEAMSLYNHVAGKDDVLDGMVDLVVGEIELPGPEADWRQAMRQRAVSALKAFKRHPWASALIDSRMSGGPGRLRYFESVIGALRRAGFSIRLAGRAFSLLDSYIYGFCRQSVGIAAVDAGEAPAAETFLKALPVEQFPYLAEMAAMQSVEPGYDEDSDFEFGLTLILDGLEKAREEGGP